MSVATCSEPVLRLAAEWLADCVGQHTKCAEKFNPLFHPTRLMTIVGKNGTRIVKLLETNSEQVSPPPPYIALSYCWGQGDTVKLLSNTYEPFSSQGIRLDQLPRTMQQAIDLALYLGMQWIWIDALCIT